MNAGHASRSSTLPADLARRLDPVHAPLPDLSGGDLRYAAVVATILEGEASPHEGAPSLLFTKRSSQLRKHAGQISFPGGKPEAGDRDLLSTALREANEEVGLDADLVHVLGRLDPVPTPTGFLIVPFVGRIRAPWKPDVRSPDEVERLLTPTVGQLADPEAYFSQGTARWRGIEYTMHAYRIDDPPLWGATARMVFDFLGRMRDGAAE